MLKRLKPVLGLFFLGFCLMLPACGPADRSGDDGETPATDASAGPVNQTDVAENPRFSSATGARIRVLGTAQDGGLPHAACSCVRCERAKSDPDFAQFVASLGIILPESDRVFVIDATPDLRGQLDLLADVRTFEPGRVDRAPLDGILLTHAHLGHYTGLAFLGFEAVHAQQTPVHASEAMSAFLTQHAPWSQLVEKGNIVPTPFEMNVPVELGDGITFTAFKVPHRDEFADTVGYLLSGPRNRVLYIPDTDSWDAWPEPVERWLEQATVAIIDGTFYSMDELPGRDVSNVPHPLITDSIKRFESWSAAGGELCFSHLNHSNPALDPLSDETAFVRSHNARILRQRDEIEL